MPSDAELTMKEHMHLEACSGKGGRTIGRLGATLALLVLPVALCTGCDDALLREFRSAAAGSLQTGLTSILNGVVQGVFAVVSPSDPNSTRDPNAAG